MIKNIYLGIIFKQATDCYYKNLGGTYICTNDIDIE